MIGTSLIRSDLLGRWAEVEAALDGGSSQADGAAAFREAATQGNLVPIFQRILSDHLTPVLAYRCLVAEDDRSAPSFLFESVVNGDQQVRSCGEQPAHRLAQSALSMCCSAYYEAAEQPVYSFQAAQVHSTADLVHIC